LGRDQTRSWPSSPRLLAEHDASGIGIPQPQFLRVDQGRVEDQIRMINKPSRLRFKTAMPHRMWLRPISKCDQAAQQVAAERRAGLGADLRSDHYPLASSSIAIDRHCKFLRIKLNLLVSHRRRSGRSDCEPMARDQRTQKLTNALSESACGPEHTLPFPASRCG